MQYTLGDLMTQSIRMYTASLPVVHVRILIDLKQKRISPHGGSNENIENLGDAAAKQCCMEPTSRTYSTSANNLAMSSSTPTARHQSRPKGYNSDDNLCEQSREVELPSRAHGRCVVSRPNSLESSRNASNSSSPLSLKGSLDQIHGRSESLGSEDMVPSRDTTALSRDSQFCHSSSVVLASIRQDLSPNRNGLLSYDMPQSNPVQFHPGRLQTASPGSEMVTLEEFLKESNRLSPPSDASSNRDDLLSDYFRKANEPSPIGNQLAQTGRKEAAKMPTSYVTPTVKMAATSEEGRAAKPGHCVKPNRRLTEPEPLVNSTGSLKLTHTSQNQPLNSLRQMAQSSTLSRRSASLSRAFSLASADLLTSTGPEAYRQESSQKPAADICVSRDSGSQSSQLSALSCSRVSLRERPQSAKASVSVQGIDSRCRQPDVRRFSLAPPKDERPLSSPQSSSSPTASTSNLNSQQQERTNVGSGQHYSPVQYTTTKVRSKLAPRSGEVATVTPVRVVSSNTEGDVSQGQNPSDTVVTKSQSRSPECKTVSVGTEDSNRSGGSKSNPASPDPQGDQQTVWYEYGCV
uniref:Uncharacterized protein n=1 Tax=Sphenodon punctatus TaxID=8508 RepID=A0A8D0H1L4_SPHPU